MADQRPRSGVGGHRVLPADLAVQDHGEDHAEDQQDGDGKGDSDHDLHVILHPGDDPLGAGRGVDFAGVAVCVGGVTAAGVGNLLPVSGSLQNTTTLHLPLQLLQVVSHALWLIRQRRELFHAFLHPALHLLLTHGSQDAGRQQEDEDDEEGDEEQQQHAAVLFDGSTAAQEAEHHDDHADGDHQVDARKRFIRDLVSILADFQVDGDAEDDAATDPEKKVEEEEKVLDAFIHSHGF